MSYKTTVVCISGFCLVVLGISLSIRDWVYIQEVFRGVIGPALAVAGLLVLFWAQTVRK
jgi:hypothetical protein